MTTETRPKKKVKASVESIKPALFCRTSQSGKFLSVRLVDEDKEPLTLRLFWRWCADNDIDISDKKDHWRKMQAIQIPGHLRDSLEKFFTLVEMEDSQWYSGEE